MYVVCTCRQNLRENELQPRYWLVYLLTEDVEENVLQL